jgi:hypothetical protein
MKKAEFESRTTKEMKIKDVLNKMCREEKRKKLESGSKKN